ncbi:MAG: hypothetical protein MUF29_10985 [Chitinophagaceae bacterium]|nr:hypothetical protein [Chitinophagaceae bacterium]
MRFRSEEHVMQDLEPFYRWRDQYVSEEDERSPFFGIDHSQFEYSTTVYNYYIHPQWDDMGSRTLFLKVLFADYKKHFVVIELIGEWNDAIENDIMTFRREVIDPFMQEGITKFILIAENVLNFHSSEPDYYEEWYENVADENGWIVCLNMPESSQYDFRKLKLQYYVELKEFLDWRRYQPEGLFQKIDNELKKRLT